MTPEEFPEQDHKLIDWVADFRSNLRMRPVMSRVQPGEVKAHLPAAPPQAAEPFERIFADLDAIIAPACRTFSIP